jgi:hypothetical protein
LWNVTRVWACLAWPGCTETATKSSPINAPVALAVAKKTRGTPEGSPGRC